MFRSIGARLTLWYASMLAVALLLFGGGVWFALEHSLFHAVDESLHDRVEGIRQFIDLQTDSFTLDELRQEFREHSVLGPGGDLFQVADGGGAWLYRSDPLYDENVPQYTLEEIQSGPRFDNVNIQDIPLRFLSQPVTVAGQQYAVQVAAPLGEIERGLREFLVVLLPLLGVALVIAAGGGYWISLRALKPVDHISETARAIGASNLSERLAVTGTGDELDRLAGTLNEMIDRLEAAFKRISRFTADASHELRTPLALMRTTAEVALKTTDTTERGQALEAIVAEIETTSHLVDKLLLIARTDAGEPVLELRLVDLTKVLEEVCTQVAVLARAKSLNLSVAMPDVHIHVNADAQALRQLFVLLIDNAIKYTPGGGDVEVRLEMDNQAIVTITDTGIGIDDAELPHIFERFYRVDRARSREQGGAGLGLAIARWIARAHGGEVSAQSQPGVGSVFIVRLPAASPSSDPSHRQ